MDPKITAQLLAAHVVRAGHTVSAMRQVHNDLTPFIPACIIALAILIIAGLVRRRA
jgi:hypothetical protein